jgi:hypothetical protein
MQERQGNRSAGVVPDHAGQAKRGGQGWSLFEAEAERAFAGPGRFRIRAYSEFMPPPYVGCKPYEPGLSRAECTASATGDLSLDITEYEQAQELEPGLVRIASVLVTEIAKLARGTSHRLSHTLLDGNPAWPAALADAALQHGFRHETFSIALPLSLSRTQDDKGNVRWTLFGASHDGAARPFWASFGDDDEARFARTIAWMTAEEDPPAEVRVIADLAELPAFARPLLLADAEPLDGVRTVVTFRPFADLPPRVQNAYLARRLRIAPSPASLLFFEHRRYRELARALPLATQIPLLHVFPRIEEGYAIRIPQSGWLDEHHAHQDFAGGHRIVSKIVRTHRWQRVPRDQAVGDAHFADAVTTALFSTDPDDVGLYGKPMAKNAQIWSEDYALVLDGPRAEKAELARAAAVLAAGGHFGYRFFYPPMKGGPRDLFWHLPIVARLQPQARHATRLTDDAPLGYVSAENAEKADHSDRVFLTPRLLDRPAHREAATLFPRDPGHSRNTTCHNIRKVLDFADLVGAPLAPSFARQLIEHPKHASFDDCLARLGEIAAHPHAAHALAEQLRGLASGQADDGSALTFGQTATRDYEERLWRTIAELAEGEFLNKENADAIAVNRGKTGGNAARLAGVKAGEHADLERLGDHLHARYRWLISKHGMSGRAEVVDHVFRWETDFDFAWSEGWAKNQKAPHERNVVVMIPGRNRAEAVIMADHYDTAYMEDVYEEERGGDGLRVAAHGADDNHSGTASLLLAAEVLLPLAQAGKLERDVWLVHLTGEEFPADCMGARALAQGLVEKTVAFTKETGEKVDVSRVRAKGVYVLDMVAHNNMHNRDAFFICPGEGAASAKLALTAHFANERWNRLVVEKNHGAERLGKGRAQRMPDGKSTPPPFEHLAVAGQIAAEWEPRSVLYNTDGQIFSDVGVPVVLIMENYDINRVGYHDTHDTMKNIDLDYAAALSAIAIESVVQLAMTPEG